jgi:cytochrome c oxidase subunit I+III
MTEIGGRTDLLNEAWDTRPGFIGWLGAVNHKQIGKRYIVTALVFFVIGGVQALLLRIQLGSPESTFLSPELYNELFTMHGTTMMFLFAVPITEAVGIYFLPLMVGQRDMPFPRVNAFGYWAYLIGGIFLYTSFFNGTVPDAGWFAYTPLSSTEGTPTASMDYWLLGVTFVEIAGIVAAIELIVLALKARCAGMALFRMPLFAWSQLTTAIMVIFAFPPLVAASTMLELERKLGFSFYDPARGGDPELWAHLFWWFGHPEVYIIAIPGFGILSMIIPTFARHRIVGYPYIAAATVSIGIVSFGIWAHHMYTTGIPLLALSYFAAGSFLIAIPSGVQFFAWIATMWRGKVQWNVAMLWVVGALVTFLAGGITGVMVASVPFDWQAHDTYFVVAHMHYVIMGSVVFPIFAAAHYWAPKITGRVLSERWGKVAFWLTMVGMNGTFLIQHALGLIGMPRRVYTYPEGLDWTAFNVVSTVGAMILGLGFAIALLNVVVGFFRGAPAGSNPWQSGTLEWAATSPPAQYNFRRVPFVHTLDPLWEQERVDDPGEHGDISDMLFEVEHPRREILVTSMFDAVPERVVTIPAHSLWPLWTALSVALFLLGALVDQLPLIIIGLAATLVSLIGFGWSREDIPDIVIEQEPAPDLRSGT